MDATKLVGYKRNVYHAAYGLKSRRQWDWLRSGLETGLNKKPANRAMGASEW
jgi:hypothetical protein